MEHNESPAMPALKPAPCYCADCVMAGARTVPPLPIMPAVTRAGSSGAYAGMCDACLADATVRRHYVNASGVLMSAVMCEPCGTAWAQRMDGAR